MIETRNRLTPKCSRPEVFWGEIAPCEHAVEIYADEEAFLDSLENFVSEGLNSGESVIVIASAPHRSGLEKRLQQRGTDLEHAQAKDRLISLDAHLTLQKFMSNGWPSDELFAEVVLKVLQRARTGGRRVRAFGEMVAVLWAQGHNGATVRLEHLWNEFMRAHSFSLFCAYPKSGFTDKTLHSLHQICSAHSRVIGID